MTQNKFNMPLKLEPLSNRCLAWSISYEIRYGDHSFDGLRKLVLTGDFNDVRRYSEVLYHKTLDAHALFSTLLVSLNERCSFADNVEEFVKELRDWGFEYSKRDNRVSQDIKEGEKK